MFIEMGADSRGLGVVRFRSAWAAMVYKGNEKTEEQQRSPKGLPLWKVRAEIDQGNGAEEIRVLVPCKANPAEALKKGDEIIFKNLVAVSGQKKDGGRWERLEASAIGRAKPHTK